MTFEVYRDASNQFRWRLRAGNGRTVAESGESYVERSAALHGIALVQASGEAEIKDVDE